MMFKNSMRLLFSNFSSVWKILFYRVLVGIIILGLTTLVAIPIFYTLSDANFFVDMENAFSGFMLNLDIYSIINSISTIINSLINIIADNFEVLLPNLIGIFLIVTVLGGFLNGLLELAIAENLNGYMSSMANYGVANSYVRKIGKSIFLQFVKLFINLPINMLIIYTIYSMLPMLSSANHLIVLFAPLAIITAATVMFALNLTIFCGVIPAIIVHDCGIFRGFAKGFRAVRRRFFKTLSNSIVITLTIIVINIFILSITGGAGLIVSLPASIFLVAIFGMVMYYGSMGMKYYVDPDTILTPKSLEEQDKIRQIKYII